MSKRRTELIIVDIVIVIAAYYLEAFLLKLNVSSMRVPGDFNILKLLMMCCCIFIFRAVFQIYRSIWRYANMRTYLRLLMADFCGGAVFVLMGRFIESLSLGITGSMIILMWIMLLTLCSRFVYQNIYSRREIRGDVEYGHEIHKIDIAIVGAGNVGASLAEELLRNPRSHYSPYCFIDKDYQKVGNGINGLPILPEDDQIVERLKKLPVQEIVIALPDTTAENRLRLFELYKQTECKVKIYDYPLKDDGKHVDGTAEERRLREFHIEDLLFRESLTVNSKQTEEFYLGKTILVTGGGGSIGSELCRQIAEMRSGTLAILDIYENNAYDIQQELIQKYGAGLQLKVFIGSVRDQKRVEEIFRELRPDIVFHAAAHKHVPLMESSGSEAIKNNVCGTYNVANMAEKYGVKKFLLISTDKAVNPTNIMGASKRLCEMVIQCRSNSKTEFTAVRFGNVLGSNGSVIPLFKRQLENGGPLTLTDKRIIRYFMTIPEAVGLVLETCAMARNGELFVLNMGKPVKILELAENMICLSGLRPYEDIDIVEIGLRPGEKLYEELLMKTEELDRTDNEMIFIERDKGLSREEVEEKLRILLEAVEKEGYENILQAVRQTVPTYHDPKEVNDGAAQSEEMKSVRIS